MITEKVCLAQNFLKESQNIDIGINGNSHITFVYNLRGQNVNTEAQYSTVQYI